MLINTEFDKRTVVHAGKTDWIPTRMQGVERRMLDRIGAESGHATTIVRYAPGSSFSSHVHQGGEEFVVLEGIFQDEHGDFPAGTYVRNPPQSKHTPGSDDGCTIFVKLWQFDPADRKGVVIDTTTAAFNPDPTNSAVQTLHLHGDAREDVRIEKWQPDQRIDLDAPDGMEILVLEGSFEEAGETFEKHAWLRLPRGFKTAAFSGSNGTRLWIKRNHLAQAPEVKLVKS